MPDDIVVTPGTGETVAADERTINSVSKKVQRVLPQCATSFATGQVAPTATAATLIGLRNEREFVEFVNQGTVDVYIGPATVTTANGFKLVPGAGQPFYTTALIQAITASGTGLIHYIEYWS